MLCLGNNLQMSMAYSHQGSLGPASSAAGPGAPPGQLFYIVGDLWADCHLSSSSFSWPSLLEHRQTNASCSGFIRVGKAQCLQPEGRRARCCWAQNDTLPTLPLHLPPGPPQHLLWECCARCEGYQQGSVFYFAQVQLTYNIWLISYCLFCSSTVDLQYLISFRCTARWFISTFFFRFFTLIGYYRILTTVPCWLSILYIDYFLYWWVYFCFRNKFICTSFFFLATLLNLWDLSSPTRDWTWATVVKAQHLSH